MPDKSDVYFIVGAAITWWVTYGKGTKHRLRQWNAKRQKRRGRHRKG